MEVGAVKQAFNNEVIQLKRNLNQAKIQTIHKLTRKAKTFADKKKPPEKLKEKLKRKAESAVNEVLIIKKIKPRDIARFTVTHTGILQDYLNRPTVDQDKACARLLLHKSLQEKYNAIRNRFSGIPIKDLLMSRQERRKLKREALLDKKAKKDKKQKVVNAKGEWNVETVKPTKNKDVKKNASIKFNESDLSGEEEEMDQDENADSDVEANSNDEAENSNDEVENSNDEAENSNDEVENSNDEEENSNDEEEKSDNDDAKSDDQNESEGQKSESNDNEKFNVGPDDSEEESEAEIKNDQESDVNSAEESDNDKISGKLVKPNPAKVAKETKTTSFALTFDQLGKNRRKPEIKTPSKPKDVHKNKNLKEKLQSRKFKKELHEVAKKTKIVDPFFITSTGENYMSVAEPRQPDEVKEIHKEGNRRERRAAMFGHAPKVKPRQDSRHNNFNRQNDSGFKGKFNRSDDSKGNEGRNRNDSRNDGFRNKNDRNFRGQNDRNRNDKQFDGNSNKFKGGNDKPFEGKNSNFKGKNDANFKGQNDVKPKVEKLHPSWEAKKKQSGILPFQGKKIVFD